VEREKTVKSVEGILRSEYRTANSYALAKGISDLEELGVLNCTLLREGGEVNRTFYDTTHQPECWQSGILKDLFTAKSNFQALNGMRYSLQFQHDTSTSTLILEFMSYLIVVLAFSLYARHWQKQKSSAEMRMSVLKLERELALDTAHQIRHDVASPLSVLRAAVAAMKNSDPEIKELLNKAIKRTEEVFGQLSRATSDNSESNDAGVVCLNECLNDIIHEKMTIWKDGSQIDLDCDSVGEINVFANSGNLKRVLSNLLDNSHESKQADSDLTISVKIDLNPNTAKILIRDNGMGMSHDVIRRLGTKHFSHGKENHPTGGSGLGTYYAKMNLEKWGGQLAYDSSPGEGTTATITLRRLHQS